MTRSLRRYFPGLILVLVVSACSGDSTDNLSSESANPGSETTSSIEDSSGEQEASDGEAATAESVLEPESESGQSTLQTPCFVADFELPDEYIAADVSPDSSQCWFITQQENLADTTVIAGELWKSSSGNSFDGFVEFVENGLTQGQEPDLLPLQSLNTAASGRDLPVIERIDVDGPNRAVVFRHESDRRDGREALSAVVNFNTDRDSDTTVILMWGLANEENDKLFFELIDAMQLNPEFVPG